MLKGIDARLTAPLLASLAEMGHGDEIAIVDANFPGASTARRLLLAPGLAAPDMLEAILSLMPIDRASGGDEAAGPVAVMCADDPGAPHEIFEAFARVCRAAEGQAAGGDVPLGRIDRFGFYERARRAYAIVQTGERRLYGNIIVRMGVVSPGAPA
jgi:L-fucose mutarotase